MPIHSAITTKLDRRVLDLDPDLEVHARASKTKTTMIYCKQCGEPIRWERKNGRWFCFNADGSDHWDLCSKVRWQQTVATGTRFEEKDGTGYRASVHGTKYDMKTSGAQTGRNFRPTGLCRSCVSPWEVCKECPDALSI